MKCPRRIEGPFAYHDGDDDWHARDGYLACSYCGSMHPDDFFQAIEDGHMIIGTDKNYKVYVEMPNPLAGKTVEIGSESGPAFDREGKPNKPDLSLAEKASGHYQRKIMGTASTTVQAKFYFQHLDEDGQNRFIALYNEHRINLEPRFGLYRAPYFCAPVKA